MRPPAEIDVEVYEVCAIGHQVGPGQPGDNADTEQRGRQSGHAGARVHCATVRFRRHSTAQAAIHQPSFRVVITSVTVE